MSYIDSLTGRADRDEPLARLVGVEKPLLCARAIGVLANGSTDVVGGVLEYRAQYSLLSERIPSGPGTGLESD